MAAASWWNVLELMGVLGGEAAKQSSPRMSQAFHKTKENRSGRAHWILLLKVKGIGSSIGQG